MSPRHNGQRIARGLLGGKGLNTGPNNGPSYDSFIRQSTTLTALMSHLRTPHTPLDDVGPGRTQGVNRYHPWHNHAPCFQDQPHAKAARRRG